jgi:hypothetical protein
MKYAVPVMMEVVVVELVDVVVVVEEEVEVVLVVVVDVEVVEVEDVEVVEVEVVVVVDVDVVVGLVLLVDVELLDVEVVVVELVLVVVVPVDATSYAPLSGPIPTGIDEPSISIVSPTLAPVSIPGEVGTVNRKFDRALTNWGSVLVECTSPLVLVCHPANAVGAPPLHTNLAPSSGKNML